MHVSYRKPFGLFVGTCGDGSVAKTCDAGRTFVDVPPKTPRWEQRKLRAHRYLWRLFDLFFQEFIKSPESTWEHFWTPRRPPGDPKRHPEDPQGTSQGTSHRPNIIELTSNSHQTHIELTSNPHRTHIDLTSNSHRPHIDLPSTSHRTHIELSENHTYIQIFYREWNSRYLASGDRMLGLSQRLTSAFMLGNL